MNINTWIYIFLGFWFLVILWWGLRVMDDRMDLVNCNEISAFEVSVVYIMVWGFLVKLGFVWIFAIPVASFVTLLLGKISKNNYIYCHSKLPFPRHYRAICQKYLRNIPKPQTYKSTTLDIQHKQEHCKKHGNSCPYDCICSCF